MSLTNSFHRLFWLTFQAENKGMREILYTKIHNQEILSLMREKDQTAGTWDNLKSIHVHIYYNKKDKCFKYKDIL